jgi:hypothetical protein
MHELAHRSSELEPEMHAFDSMSKHLDEADSKSSPHRRNYEQEKGQVCVMPCFCYAYLQELWKRFFSSFSLFGFLVDV